MRYTALIFSALVLASCDAPMDRQLVGIWMIGEEEEKEPQSKFLILREDGTFKLGHIYDQDKQWYVAMAGNWKPEAGKLKLKVLSCGIDEGQEGNTLGLNYHPVSASRWDATHPTWELPSGEVHEEKGAEKFAFRRSERADLLELLTIGPVDEQGGLYSDPAAPFRAQPKAAKRQHTERFREAYELIYSNPAKALEKLEENIRETPNATDIDYDLGWAMVCCARLGKYNKAYEYYATLRRSHYGWLTEGAGGATRNWDSKHAEVRSILKDSGDAKALALYESMLAIDNECRQRLEDETLALAKKANSGD
jgi:hypothetical protein